MSAIKNRYVILGSYYVCWILLVLVSMTYGISTLSPWSQQIIHNLSLPDVDPVIFTDTRGHAVKTPPISTKENLRLFYEQAKNSDFYSTVDNSAYSEVFYRPDFANYPTETILILFFRLSTYVGIVIFLFLLARLLHTVNQGEPFRKANHQRIFYMGFIMIVLPIIRTLHSLVLAGYVQYDPMLVGWQIKPAWFYLWFILAGIFILILGSIFKEGNRIHQEQKLTV